MFAASRTLNFPLLCFSLSAFSFLPFTLHSCSFAPLPHPLHSGSSSPSTNQTVLEQIQRSVNKNKSSPSKLKRFQTDFNPECELQRPLVLQRMFLLFFKAKRNGLSLKGEVTSKGKKKRTQNLTKYGQYAEQDGDEGMDAHSHPLSTGFTLCPIPPLITPTRLKQVNK